MLSNLLVNVAEFLLGLVVCQVLLSVQKDDVVRAYAIVTGVLRRAKQDVYENRLLYALVMIGALVGSTLTYYRTQVPCVCPVA